MSSHHYLGKPALSWNTMANVAKVNLKLLPKKMRGRVSYISNRYSKANNKYLKSYDPIQESKHITYLDANNLYGYAMFKFIPTSGFEWIDAKECDLNKYTTIVQKDVFSNLILNILKSYENYTIIIH